jgi:hypothetical protein
MTNRNRVTCSVLDPRSMPDNTSWSDARSLRKNACGHRKAAILEARMSFYVLSVDAVTFVPSIIALFFCVHCLSIDIVSSLP